MTYLTKTPIIIIAVALIASTITFAALYVFVIQPFQLPDNTFPSTSPTSTRTLSPTANPSLSPARDLVGTWKTSFSTKFYIKTDFSSAQLEDVGSENRTMTWVITSTNNENVINIEITFATSNRDLISDSGYTPDVLQCTLRAS